MTRRSRRLRRGELAAAALIVILGIALAVVALSGSSGSPSHPTSSARPTALAFGRSYLAYLGGAGSVRALADTTAAVRTTAAAGGSIPARDRVGGLRLAGVTINAVAGAPRASALVSAGNRRLSLKTAIGLSYVGGRWRVSSLVPPDLSTLVTERAPAAPVPPALHAAAARFAREYADFRAQAGPRPSGILALLGRQLSAGRDPLARLSRLAPLAPRGARARLTALRVVPGRTLATAAASLSDRGRRLRFSFVLRRAGGVWRPWQFPQPGTSG